MTRGVIAVGDSIINGRTASLVVPAQSWALWLAQANGLEFTRNSVGGVTSEQVALTQLPQESGWDVAGLSMGANDVLEDWDEVRFARNLSFVVGHLRAVASRVVVTNLPTVFRDLPGAPPYFRSRRVAVNRIINDVAGDGVVDVSDVRGLRWLHADRVHLTALGSLEVADRAARVLGWNAPSVSVELGRVPVRAVGAYAGRWVEATSRVVVKRAIGRTRT